MVDTITDFQLTWFSTLGAKLIHDLQVRQSYAFIGVMGRRIAKEAKSTKKWLPPEIYRKMDSDGNHIEIKGKVHIDPVTVT